MTSYLYSQRTILDRFEAAGHGITVESYGPEGAVVRCTCSWTHVSKHAVSTARKAATEHIEKRTGVKVAR